MAYLDNERERIECCASKLALGAALSPSDVRGNAAGSPKPVSLRFSIFETAKEIKHGHYLQASRTVGPTATEGPWFSESPEYAHWSGERASQSLVLFGPPGCGKTTSSKLAVKRLLEGRAFDEVVTFYFFGNDGLVGQSHNIPLLVLSMLVAQIVGRTLDTSFLQTLADEELKSLDRAMKSADQVQKAIDGLSCATNRSVEVNEQPLEGLTSLGELSEDKLWRILRKVVLTAHEMTISCIYIVIDGIDEALPKDGVRFIRNLRVALDSTKHGSATVAETLISSRRCPDIEQHLDGWPFVDPEKERRGKE